MRIIDYLFYRMYQYYRKGEKDIPRYVSSLVLSLTCVFTILSLLTLSKRIFGFDAFHSYTTVLKTVIYSLLFIILALVLLRYSRDCVFSSLEGKYENEERSARRRNGFLCVLYIAIVFGIPLVF